MLCDVLWSDTACLRPPLPVTPRQQPTVTSAVLTSYPTPIELVVRCRTCPAATVVAVAGNSPLRATYTQLSWYATLMWRGLCIVHCACDSFSVRICVALSIGRAAASHPSLHAHVIRPV
jgi:hypothetical protein